MAITKAEKEALLRKSTHESPVEEKKEESQERDGLALPDSLQHLENGVAQEQTLAH